MDLFDYKPRLKKEAGNTLPYALPNTEATVGLDNTRLLGPVSTFSHRGQCGLHMSDLLPGIGQHADDLCVLRAVQSDSSRICVRVHARGREGRRRARGGREEGERTKVH